jgi:hypothetical protein
MATSAPVVALRSWLIATAIISATGVADHPDPRRITRGASPTYACTESRSHSHSPAPGGSERRTMTTPGPSLSAWSFSIVPIVVTSLKTEDVGYSELWKEAIAAPDQRSSRTPRPSNAISPYARRSQI